MCCGMLLPDWGFLVKSNKEKTCQHQQAKKPGIAVSGEYCWRDGRWNRQVNGADCIQGDLAEDAAMGIKTGRNTVIGHPHHGDTLLNGPHA